MATELCGCFAPLLEALKPEYAEILRRVDLEGRKPAEFARETGITPNHAMVRLHRARKALRADLASYGVVPKVDATFADPTELAATARDIITRLKEAGVTTVVYTGDPFAPGTLTKVATEQGYFPEWVITGTSLIRQTGISFNCLLVSTSQLNCTSATGQNFVLTRRG